MQMINNVVMIIIGWALGLLSPLIAEKAKLKKKKMQLLNAISIELHELRAKLACTSYLLGKYAKFNREFLEWCFSILSDYKGTESVKNILNDIEKLLNLNDDQIESVRESTALRKSMGLSLKHYEIPFTLSHAGELSILDIRTQNIILNIKFHIGSLNGEIDMAMKYHFMTYDSSISEENHEILLEDIKRTYVYIQKQAMLVTDKIGEFLNMCKNLKITEGV